jgi:hypothetical protein
MEGDRRGHVTFTHVPLIQPDEALPSHDLSRKTNFFLLLRLKEIKGSVSMSLLLIMACTSVHFPNIFVAFTYVRPRLSSPDPVHGVDDVETS